MTSPNKTVVDQQGPVASAGPQLGANFAKILADDLVLAWEKLYLDKGVDMTIPIKISPPGDETLTVYEIVEVLKCATEAEGHERLNDMRAANAVAVARTKMIGNVSLTDTADEHWDEWAKRPDFPKIWDAWSKWRTKAMKGFCLPGEPSYNSWLDFAKAYCAAEDKPTDEGLSKTEDAIKEQIEKWSKFEQATAFGQLRYDWDSVKAADTRAREYGRVERVVKK